MASSAQVVVCPDSFKGSMSATEAAQALTEGVLSVAPDARVVALPLADGGEGTTEVLVAAARANAGTGSELGRFVQWHEVAISSLDGSLCPAQSGVQARWAQFEGGAVVDLASAVGFAQRTYQVEQRLTSADPLVASSYAAGELLRSCLECSQVSRIYVGLGGSTTNDCGLGLLCALGARAYDDTNQSLLPCANNLDRIATLDVSACGLPAHKELRLLLDVDNPLLGPAGATYTFGPQKGVPQQGLATLEAAMERCSVLVEQAFGGSYRQALGAGAAGGLGFALLAACGAKSTAGGAEVLRLVGARELFAHADLVLTGEGKLDEQSIHGKLVSQVCALASEVLGLSVGAVVGQSALESAADMQLGLCVVEELCAFAPSVAVAQRHAAKYAKQAAARAYTRWLCAQQQ